MGKDDRPLYVYASDLSNFQAPRGPVKLEVLKRNEHKHRVRIVGWVGDELSPPYFLVNKRHLLATWDEAKNKAVARYTRDRDSALKWLEETEKRLDRFVNAQEPVWEKPHEGPHRSTTDLPEVQEPDVPHAL